MATPTRTHPRAASSGRFPRQLPTRRAASPTRRSGVSPRQSPRPQLPFRHRQPEKSTAGKVLEQLTGRLTRSNNKGAGGNRGKATAGVAVLAGAASLAFKNRDKLLSLIPGGKPNDQPGEPSTLTTPAAAPDLPARPATDEQNATPPDLGGPEAPAA